MKLSLEDRLRKALAAHPGPWELETYVHRCAAGRERQMFTIYDRDADLCETGDRKDAEFLVGLRDLLLAAVAEIEQLRAQVAREQVEL